LRRSKQRHPCDTSTATVSSARSRRVVQDRLNLTARRLALTLNSFEHRAALSVGLSSMSATTPHARLVVPIADADSTRHSGATRPSDQRHARECWSARHETYCQRIVKCGEDAGTAGPSNAEAAGYTRRFRVAGEGPRRGARKFPPTRRAGRGRDGMRSTRSRLCAWRKKVAPFF